MKIAVIGAGYVGFANALLFAQNNKIKVVDTNLEKVSLINNGISPLNEKLCHEYINRYKQNIHACAKLDHGIKKYNLCIISTPTDFDKKTNSFDTSSIELTLHTLNSLNYQNNIVIRSTVPVGYTDKISEKFKNLSISFIPEFLREGSALYDSIYPSRIVIGSNNSYSNFIKPLKESIKKQDIKLFKTSPSEAEAIKLFSNSFLAMRVAFFNELDTFAMMKNLNSKNIIQGICEDPRIGNYYNNPSFGYGGYCLPKDTMQLNSDFKDLKPPVINSIIKSNKARKKYLSEKVLSCSKGVIGIYKLSMKSNADNYKGSATLDLLTLLKSKRKIIIYEPTIENKSFRGIKVENNFNKFLSKSKIIIANRLDKKIKDFHYKVFSRDIFQKD